MTDLLTLAEKISTASPRIREFAIEAAKQIAALQAPQPAPTKSGVGLYQLGGSLAGCSHLTDGTYATVIGDWDDAPLLAKVSGLGFAYTVTAATAPGWTLTPALDAANPQTYIDAVLAHQAQHGYKGVFLDNCIAQVSGLLGALSTVGRALRARNVLFAANVGNFVAGNPGSDDGTLWMQWAQQVAPYLDYGMLENWMQFSGGPLLGQLRTDLNGGNKSGWQRCPAAQLGSMRFMAVTYGPPAPGTTADAAAYGKAALLASPGVRTDAVYVHSTPGRDPYGSWAG